LVNQANDGVGCNFRGTAFNIGIIGLIGPILAVAQATHFPAFRVVLAPKAQALLPEKVFEVQQKLFKACTSNTDQFQLGFLGSP